MKSQRTKRILVVLAMLTALVIVAAGYGAYMLTRDPGFDWENANLVEAGEAKRKLRLYDKSLGNGHVGWIGLSQVQINSFLSPPPSTNKMAAAAAKTNAPAKTDTNAPVAVSAPDGPLQLKKIGVSLGDKNLTVFSWAEYDLLKVPVKFVVQREFDIVQEGTNQWELSLTGLKIGHVEIPQQQWAKITPHLAPLDTPILDRYPWRTNIQAILVTKNDVSKRPELRLYTYKPIPDSDRH